MSVTSRSRPDRCPGVLTPASAADGALVRIRLPGGIVSAAALHALAGCARDLGDGVTYLTSRGNIQLRGLATQDDELPRRLSLAGLMPPPSHERVRNILASPLSGIAGGLADVRGLAAGLDRALCARPLLAALPGRFLFAVDDGRGDVAAEGPDLCWRATGADTGTLLVAGTDTGLVVSRCNVPSVLADAAEAFLVLRAGGSGDPRARAWRAVELPGAAARLAALLPGVRVAPRVFPAGAIPAPAELLGPIADGVVGAAPVLGEVSAAALHLLSGLSDGVVVTPWRTVLLPRARRGALGWLAAAGFVVDPDAPAATVSACTGRPGCGLALSDVRSDVRAALMSGGLPPAERIHVVGCARGCGTPHGPHRRIEAVPGGYTGPGAVHGRDVAAVAGDRQRG